MKKYSISQEHSDFRNKDIEIPLKKTLCRIDETAQILGISDQQVRNFADAGELEAVPINSSVKPEPARRHVRITSRSIEAFINKRRLML